MERSPRPDRGDGGERPERPERPDRIRGEGGFSDRESRRRTIPDTRTPMPPAHAREHSHHPRSPPHRLADSPQQQQRHGIEPSPIELAMPPPVSIPVSVHSPRHVSSPRGQSPNGDGDETPTAAPSPGASPANASPTPHRPRVPSDVANAYAMSSMLGSGAFGTVWAASQRATGERVAIKIVERKRQLNEDFSLEPAEAEILKQVSHPHIVKLIDMIATEACVYLVMELVMGGHLQARLKAEGAYDEARARIILRQVVAAVHHLHELSVTHRDIKPENILFSEAEAAADGANGADGGSEQQLSVKLTDFGLSTMKEGRLTTRCGTPSYCAPELLAGEGYGKAVDLWSLGVLTYVLLRGVLPFVGSDRADLFKRIQRGHYSYDACGADGKQREVSEVAKDLISRLLRVEPMERYSTRETLQHPWLRAAAADADADADADGGAADADGGGEVRLDNLDTVHEMMRHFIAERRLRKAINVVIACGRFRRAGLGWPAEERPAAKPEAAAASDWAAGGAETSRDSPPAVPA